MWLEFNVLLFVFYGSVTLVMSCVVVIVYISLVMLAFPIVYNRLVHLVLCGALKMKILLMELKEHLLLMIIKDQEVLTYLEVY